MKYQKGSFIVIPNKDTLDGLDYYIQVVYFWLCDFADEHGTCFPSRALLAKKAGMSLSTVDRALSDLEDIGMIKKTKRYHDNAPTTNLYQLYIIEGGSITGKLGSVPQTQGVASHRPTELNPVLTQPISSDHLTVVREFTSVKEETDPWRMPDVIPTPYTVESTKKLWAGSERRLQVLDWYFTEAGLWKKATSKERLKQLMARHSNAAKRIAKADWELQEVIDARKKISLNPNLEGEWTLETVEKYLTK